MRKVLVLMALISDFRAARCSLSFWYSPYICLMSSFATYSSLFSFEVSSIDDNLIAYTTVLHSSSIMFKLSVVVLFLGDYFLSTTCLFSISSSTLSFSILRQCRSFSYYFHTCC